MTGWPTAPVSKLGAGKRPFAMGPFGSRIKTENFRSCGVPVLRGKNLVGNRFDDSDVVFVDDLKAKELASSIARPGDLVFTHRGTLGQVVLVPQRSRYPYYIVSQSQMKATLDGNLILPEYAYYWFCSPEGQHSLLRNTSQTGVPAISQPLTSLQAIRVPVPPLTEQRAIAEVLGAIDDKIEANLRAIERAENLARACEALSREEIPLGDLASAERHTLAPAMFAGDDVAHYSIPAFDSTGLPVREIGANIKSGKHEVIGTMVLVSKLNPHIPRVWYAPAEPAVLAVASTEFICLRSADGVSPEELWTSCASSQFTREFQERVTGTTGSHQRVRAEDALKVPVPDPRSLSDALRSTIRASVRLAHAVRREIPRLSALRDALLPKLLSGELRVRDAESLVEDAV